MRKKLAIPGAPKELTDEEKYMQTQCQLEIALRRLQKEYNLMARDHDTSKFSRANKLKTYNRIMDIFQHERNEILTQLGVAKSKIKIDEKLAEQLDQCVDEFDMFTYNLNMAKTTLSQIQDQIKMVKKRVQHLNTLQVTDRQIQERTWKAAKSVETLENKLEVQMKKFCSIVGKNRAMRHEIHYLLIDRAIFFQIWNKFIDRLVHGKKIMMDIIEQATIAYDQREEWMVKLQALKAKAQFDFQQCILEIRATHWKQVDKQKLQEFLAVKNQKRKMNDLVQKEKENRDERHRKLKEKVKSYEKMIQDIQIFSEDTKNNVCPKIGMIALKFKQQEQRNFMYFTHIIQLIKGMEDVNESLTDMHEEIDIGRALLEARREQQQNTLESIESDLNDLQKLVKKRAANASELQNRYDRVLKGLWRLFQICKCKTDPIVALLGNTERRIDSYNAALYLQILESALQEILVWNHFTANVGKITHKKSQSATQIPPPRIFTIAEIVTTTPCALCVEYEMVLDTVEKVQNVLDREMAVQQLMNAMDLQSFNSRIHNLSKCQLPKARELIQKRYIN